MLSILACAVGQDQPTEQVSAAGGDGPTPAPSYPASCCFSCASSDASVSWSER